MTDEEKRKRIAELEKEIEELRASLLVPITPTFMVTNVYVPATSDNEHHWPSGTCQIKVVYPGVRYHA